MTSFRIKYKTLSVAYYAFCMLLLTLYQVLEMRMMEHGVEPLPGSGMVTCFVLVVFAGSFLKFYLIPGYKAYMPTKVMIFYLVYWMWIFIPIVFNRLPDSGMDQVIIFVRQMIPAFTLLLTYNFLLNHSDSKWFGWYFCGTALLYALQYFLIMRELFPWIAHMMVSYYVLYMLPLVMLTSGKKRKVFFIVFTLLVLITSIKRGGLMAMAGGLVTYGVVYLFASQKIKAKVVISAAVVLSILVGVFFYMASAMDTGGENIVERFESVEDDEGSGRLVTWIKTYELIEDSDIGLLILGHGYNAVEKDSQLGWSAHNDFLEVTYDYGLIGLVLYSVAVISFGWYVLGHIRRKTKYALDLSMFFAIYMMLSMASHVIIYPWAGVIMLTISYISGRYKYEAIHEQNNI